MSKLGVSFDVWNTLIVANPEFSKARTRSLATIIGVEPEIAKIAYTDVKKYSDECQERLGICVNHEHLVYALVNKCAELSGRHLADIVGDYHYTSYPEICRNIIDSLHYLFLQHQPKIADGVPEMLLKLMISERATVGIISNTSFVKGFWLDEILRDQIPDVMEYMKFMLWSDQCGFAKPHGFVFNRARYFARSDEIYHVGDNLITDGAAPKHKFDGFIHTANAGETASTVTTFFNL
jgi:FMN phosphatase YigB (HAD superfamily)